MLKSLGIKGFQSHRDTFLEFDPGLNIIVGPSDNGKSAILRAFEWLLTNRPSGTEFMASDGSIARITAETMGGNVAIRERDEKTTGFYEIDGERYAAMGSSVPPAVFDTLRIGELNIRGQLDTHFLILDTPGNAARFLNKVTKLDELSNALGSLRTRLANTTREIDSKKEELRETEGRLTENLFDNIHQMSVLIYSAKLIERKIKNIGDKYLRVLECVDSYSEISGEVIDQKKLDKLQNELAEIKKVFKQWTPLANKCRTLTLLLAETKQCLNDVGWVREEVVKVYREMKQAESELKLCPACGTELTGLSRDYLLGRAK